MTRKFQSSARARRYTLRRTLYHCRSLAQPKKYKQTESADSVIDVQNLQEDLVQLRETVVRQRAEFDNFRKRTQREKDQIREMAAESVLARMLPVIDNMERALASAETATEAKSVRDGVSMILLQFQRTLEGEGLQQVQSLHQPFDPLVHDALATEERSDVPDNHVCEVLLPAYKYKEKLLRAAMVKVAKNPSGD